MPAPTQTPNRPAPIPSRRRRPIDQLLAVMAQLRAPNGCPWDREQTHHSLRYHAVEEVYELLDAIEANDEAEMLEELGDLLLQVVFHCQLAQERGAFNFDQAAQTIVDKLIRRHPHVFAQSQVKNVEAVWAQWETIKTSEKAGTHRARPSLFDGLPNHLPALMHAQKVIKKARKADLLPGPKPRSLTKSQLQEELFELARYAQQKGWSAEDLLRRETKQQEKKLRQAEQRQQKRSPRA